MQSTPKSLRLQIGIFGRANIGKSSFLNMIAGQDVSITSPIAGTTTDVVEKTMELLPLGPVVFLDTAGFDDKSELGVLRVKKTKKIFDRSDVILLLLEAGVWSAYEEEILAEAKMRNIPVILVINKTDLKKPEAAFLLLLREKSEKYIECSSLDQGSRDKYINALKIKLIEVCPEGFLNPPALLGDLIRPGGMGILIVPIDLQAPKGRLILPQVQAIRDALDNDEAVVVCKEREYAHVLANLKNPPDLVVSDSQSVLKMVADTPASVKCTTFSILFSRYKGDIVEAAKGITVVENMKPGDKILIAEACSHHAIEDDIGRVKIPRWIRQYIGGDVTVDICSGRDYPENLSGYKLVVHCGACMLTRREMLARIHKAREYGVTITNYGIAIAFLQGVLTRVLSPFPAALEAYEREMKKRKRK
ncbi:MAG: [FeFe] hydrogenase H-cluster maturation GTPase HydF [Candidatus Firestonebacteria bacterium RIFOXYC2_FULL_39_67]|nr:MAG: [FeFe] hydrogenase H-cluster maturation GTPase HydF [Candidatus Firestonebacteria bacterium RIFOXYD2_FULL_39_29]OGF56604.1 MAG: [FeFe] hydrogenase H-cluster maturation GTPase HydF [Candidatus Firestonebacteria bacterium RIFOXYC2_FULL_39_67]